MRFLSTILAVTLAAIAEVSAVAIPEKSGNE
jgi:hypothetical protein